MATNMNSWPLEDFGEIFPMMSIPHTENGHGEVIAYNSNGGTWMRSLYIWHSGHLWTNWQKFVSMILRANICPPICGPQTPAWTFLITRSVKVRLKHSSNIPSDDRLYNVSPKIMNWVANCLNALLSLVVAASGYAPSLKNWYMSWYQGKSSSNFISSIKQQ